MQSWVKVDETGSQINRRNEERRVAVCIYILFYFILFIKHHLLQITIKLETNERQKIGS